MKKTLLRNSVLAMAVMLGMQTTTSAQAPLYLGGARLYVNPPSSLKGVKVTTNNIGETGWGSNTPLVPFFNKPVVEVDDNSGITNDACQNIINDLTGSVAILYRGDCEFGFKAKKAQDKGADAVIIINNEPGEPVGMGAGADGDDVDIPVFMVSKADGDAMIAELDAGNPLSVSITEWGFDFQHDLAWAAYGAPAAHAMAMPLNQFQGLTQYPDAYRFYTGGYIANIGLNDELDVVLKSEYLQGTNVLYTDTIQVDTFYTQDSILRVFTNGSYNTFAPTATGPLTIRHEIWSSAPDDDSSGNVLEYEMNITDTIFSKGRYDFERNRPVINLGYRSTANINTMTTGPMYFVAKGDGFRVDKIQMALSDEDTSTETLEGLGSVNVYIFKWEDANDDLRMQTGSEGDGGELTLVGRGSYIFSDADSSQVPFSVTIEDPEGGRQANLEDNRWYWVAAEVNNQTTFVGVDNNLNWTSRAIAAAVADPAFYEPFGPIFSGTGEDIQLNPDIVQVLGLAVGFGDVSGSLDSLSFIGGRGTAPNFSMHISNKAASSISSVNQIASKVVVYPNPAQHQINVQLAFISPVKKASLRVIDAMGRTQFTQYVDNASNQTVAIPTASLANGNYYVIIGEGTKSAVVRQFTVIK